MAQNETDTGPLARLWDVPAALVLLTRLPLPTLPDHAFAHGARAVWAYPLVGLVLGLILSAMSLALTWLGLPQMMVAGVLLGALLMLTGAMHEDGLADTADGLWGGQTRDRRLEIMKDSRIGAYGVLALIVVMGLRWLGLAEVDWTGIIAALMLSRAAMTPLMLALPHARSTGLSHSVGAPETGAVLGAVLIAVVGAGVLLGIAGLFAALIAGAVAVSVGLIAKAKIAGQTGDVLGATCALSEVAVLLALVAMA
ncbi:adenosylcobinamide-GDP ribazoletransferase [Tateyamaria omphalii]|uniref:Adenosylcobinamide-GDP ribazoletransferase n=1 Tax=Tateyamaria omphalii TaxID=299262 RepID=A0A1P8MV59_9RHOB|nr:adenosylcobinamide-GDP ribazoletransferase [Tateyamaria omphalii]APX11883.1 adenosylcobinamide-GDP ribazoletransferase [Tateyamaria omphalii]